MGFKRDGDKLPCVAYVSAPSNPGSSGLIWGAGADQQASVLATHRHQFAQAGNGFERPRLSTSGAGYPLESPSSQASLARSRS